jgi:hypothetical protein
VRIRRARTRRRGGPLAKELSVAEDRPAERRRGPLGARLGPFDDLQLHAHQRAEKKLEPVGSEVDRYVGSEPCGGPTFEHVNTVFAREIDDTGAALDVLDARVKIRNEMLNDLAIVERVTTDPDRETSALAPPGLPAVEQRDVHHKRSFHRPLCYQRARSMT